MTPDATAPSRPAAPGETVDGHPNRRRLFAIRVLVALTVVLGGNYIAWRWLFSANWAAWPIAVPLLLAETCSFVDAVLFGTTMWRLKERGPAPLVTWEPEVAGAGTT